MMGTILCNLVDLVVRMSIVDFEMRCSGDEKGYLEKKVVDTICNFFSPTTRETGFPESQSAVDTFLWFIRGLEDEGNVPAHDDGHGTHLAPVPRDPYRYRPDQQPPRPVHQLLEPARPAIDRSKTSFRLPPAVHRASPDANCNDPPTTPTTAGTDTESKTLAPLPPPRIRQPTTITGTSHNGGSPNEREQSPDLYNKHRNYKPNNRRANTMDGRNKEQVQFVRPLPPKGSWKLEKLTPSDQQKIPKRIPRPLPRSRTQEHPVFAQERGG